MESLNLKTLLNKKLESFIERKINDEDINVEIKTISFLKPDWPHIIKIKLNDINVHSSKQERKSSLKEIEFGFSYDKLWNNLFLNQNELQFNYINFSDLTLNGIIEKNKLTPGPLLKIFLLINQDSLKAQHSLKKIFQSKMVIGKINYLLSDKRKFHKQRTLDIKCEDVILSEYINKTRTLKMDCIEEQSGSFSLKAKLAENTNFFSGVVKNINPSLMMYSEKEILNLFKIFEK